MELGEGFSPERRQIDGFGGAFKPAKSFDAR
jgi:hypothetical protein